MPPHPADKTHRFNLLDITRSFDTNKEFMVGAGWAVLGHPIGPAAGARALRQAIAAAVEEARVTARAEEHPELGAAPREWGVAQEGVRGPHDLMEG